MIAGKSKSQKVNWSTVTFRLLAGVDGFLLMAI